MADRIAMSWFQGQGVTADLVDCPKCAHPWPPHELEIDDAESQQGGWITCPLCDCKVFWFTDDIVKGRG